MQCAVYTLSLHSIHSAVGHVVCCIIFICIFLTLLLFPVTHYFIIITCVHDYSPFTSVFTPTKQCLFVPLYPCSVIALFCCYTRVYITLCTSCNNLRLQYQFDLITPIVINTWKRNQKAKALLPLPHNILTHMTCMCALQIARALLVISTVRVFA